MRLSQRLRTHAILALIFVGSGIACGTATGQDWSGEVTPQVQQLYAEAKAAQQRGDTLGSVAKYQAMLKLAPHLAPAYNNLGMLYFNDRAYAQAADTLRAGLALDPGMTTAQALLGLSDAKLGRNEDAKKELEAALAANPADDRVEFALAHLLISAGNEEEGTQRLRSYLARNPKDQQAWYLLGKTYLQLSEQSLAQINAIDPNSVTAHEIAGEIDESMHNYDGALAEYNKAIQLAPNQPGTHYHLGNAFWLEGKWESAQKEFQAELRNDPTNCTTQWKLGNSLLAENGAPADALIPLDRAVAACPNLMQARVDRASALIKLNQPAKALDDLLVAEKDSPREPSIHFLLAKTYKALGRATEAKKEIETFGQLQREASAATAAQAKDVMQVKDSAQ